MSCGLILTSFVADYCSIVQTLNTNTCVMLKHCVFYISSEEQHVQESGVPPRAVFGTPQKGDFKQQPILSSLPL